MNRTALKENAKQQISGNLGALLLMCLCAGAISMLLNLIPAAGSILSFVASALFEMQFIITFLALSNGIQPEFMNLFDIFKNSKLCGNAILLQIMIAFFTFLWSLLLIVPGIIKALSYSMAPFILTENEYYMTPQDALKESMRIMDGHKADLFVLQLSFLGWYLLTVITCGIAGIYALPYYRATLTGFYNEIKNSKDAVIL